MCVCGRGITKIQMWLCIVSSDGAQQALTQGSGAGIRIGVTNAAAELKGRTTAAAKQTGGDQGRKSTQQPSPNPLMEGETGAGIAPGRGAGIRIGDLMLGHYKSALGYVEWYECKVVAEAEGGRWLVQWEDGDELD